MSKILTPENVRLDAGQLARYGHLFGQQGWAHVRRPADLPVRLAAVYARLAQRAA